MTYYNNRYQEIKEQRSIEEDRLLSLGWTFEDGFDTVLTINRVNQSYTGFEWGKMLVKCGDSEIFDMCKKIYDNTYLVEHFSVGRISPRKKFLVKRNGLGAYDVYKI